MPVHHQNVKNLSRNKLLINPSRANRSILKCGTNSSFYRAVQLCAISERSVFFHKHHSHRFLFKIAFFIVMIHQERFVSQSFHYCAAKNEVGFLITYHLHIINLKIPISNCFDYKETI